MKKIISARLDIIGFYTATLCAVHCSLIPILAILGIFTGLNWTHHPYFELLFLLISGMMAGTALFQGYFQIHRNALPLAIGVTGFALFGTGLFLPYPLEITFTSFGAILIAFSHFFNRRIVKNSQ